ncbi:MAG: ABC transporter substrate-binding protein [Xanthomonadales bacterium]|nr:ABC transporter substrate-binding protein [Gammaproteobacteria bacterium]MBT8057085.1 ABC transporter substrate-binding protein [Gammaproteobacteria bacterium]NNJ79381.1 ABC transporter substrate-binding protein [Xanthomonadales bacterium]NNL06022.1 ABC transporter substrate-binding protein [Xanthomonadales bacterium]
MNKLLITLLSTALSASLLANPGPDNREPAVIVEETTTALLDELDSRRAEFTENPALLREMVNRDMLRLIDTDYSARLILGRAGRGMETEKMDDFASAMSDHLLSRYADGLLSFEADTRPEVLPLRGNNSEKLTRVRTRFKLDDGGFVPVDFAFRKTEQGWKAFDVTIEGISYVLTYRNQISPLVAKDGIEKVTADIRAGNLLLED